MDKLHNGAKETETRHQFAERWDELDIKNKFIRSNNCWYAMPIYKEHNQG